MLEVILYQWYSGDKNSINKGLQNAKSYQCELLEDCDIVNPKINIEINKEDLPQSFNYMYIPDFGRYYFLYSPKNLNFNMWEFSGHCDVIKSFGSSILKQNDGVVSRATNWGSLNPKAVSGDELYPTGDGINTQVYEPNQAFTAFDSSSIIITTYGS